MNKQGEIVIYRAEDGQTQIDVQLEQETLWLNQEQLTVLFERDRTVIGRHIRNVFREGELDEEVVCANFAHTTEHGAIREKTQTKNVKHYNLDVIISVGYRVKSLRGTQFRVWANQVLKAYLLKGFAVNEKQLKEKADQLEELKKVIQIQDKLVEKGHLGVNETEGLLKVIANYSKALDILDDYDHQRLIIPQKGSKELYTFKNH